MYVYFQPNPCGRAVGDCAVRAISAAFNIDWEEAFDILASFAKSMCDMPSSDQVWGAALRANGFRKAILPTYCPHCYTMEDFCKDFPHGIYVVGFGGRGANARRDSMGRYSSRNDGGYSNDEGFRMSMQDLMQDAPNDYVRQKMMDAMNGM